MPVSIPPFTTTPAPGDPVASAWAQQLTAYVAPTAWTAVTFQGAWVNFGGATQVTQYRKIGDRVFVRGFVKSGVSGTAAFTLPAGFRPPALIRFPISAALGTGAGLPNASVDAVGVVLLQDLASTANVALAFDFSVSA